MKKFSQRVLLALSFIGAVGSFHGLESAAGSANQIPAWAIGVEDYPMFKGLSAYTVLGLDPNVKDAVITKQHRILSLILHPDRNKGRDNDATAAFKLLEEAYSKIKNPGYTRNQERSLFALEGAKRQAIVAGRELRERNFKNEEFAADGTLTQEALDNLWKLYQADLKDLGVAAAQAARLARRAIDPVAAQAAADAAAAEAAARAAEQAAADAQAAQDAANAAAAAQAQAAADAAAAQAAAEAAAAQAADATGAQAADAAAAAQAAAAKAQVMILVAQAAATEAEAADEVASEAAAESSSKRAKSEGYARGLGEILRARQASQGQVRQAQAPAPASSAPQTLGDILRARRR